MYNTMYELPVCTKCMHVSIIAFVFVYVQSMYYCLSDLSLWKLDVLSVMPLTWCGYQTRVYGYQTRVYGYQIRVYGYRTRGCVSSSLTHYVERCDTQPDEPCALLCNALRPK
uniref:Uncharacterized protein n=1 Tax=Cacopsylla melanoneura TaxID=428564 RepID=A0A8D8SSW9_9HEMI